MATLTNKSAYRNPPKPTQSPKTMSMWTLSRNLWRLLVVFTEGGLGMVVKASSVTGSLPVQMSLALLEASVTCCWWRNQRQRQPKILCSLRESKVVEFLHVAGVLQGRISGREVWLSWSLGRVERVMDSGLSGFGGTFGVDGDVTGVSVGFIDLVLLESESVRSWVEAVVTEESSSITGDLDEDGVGTFVTGAVGGVDGGMSSGMMCTVAAGCAWSRGWAQSMGPLSDWPMDL